MTSPKKVVTVMTQDVIVRRDLTLVVEWDSVAAKTIQSAVLLFVVRLTTRSVQTETLATHIDHKFNFGLKSLY